MSLRTRPLSMSGLGGGGLPVKFLGCGTSVLLDAEDIAFADERSWCIFTLRPSMKKTASRKDVRFGREFRVLLHREIAVRMRPDLIELKRTFRVKARNGDYLDCRRENLEITVQMASKRGRKRFEPRPKGALRKRYRGKITHRDLPQTSPLWAGGYDFREVDATHAGRGRRIRRCINGRPID